ncbi:MAG: hypothetical protein ACF8OB_20070, partial [Phycisphaeraceae bacterium JB051]
MNIRWSVMINVGVEQSQPITLKLNNSKAIDVLKIVLKKASERNELDPVTYEIDDLGIVISTQRQLLRDFQQTAVYDVEKILHRITSEEKSDPIAHNKARFTRLTEILELVRTQAGHQWEWAEFGGDCASVSFFNSHIIVKAHPKTQAQVQQLLTDINTPRMGLLPIPEPKPSHLADKLEQIITVDFHENKFKDILEFFSQSIDTPVDPNWYDLKNIGVEPDLPITLSIKNGKASYVLDQILELATPNPNVDPVAYDLTPHAIEIASKRQLYRQNAYLRSYDIRDLLEHHPAMVYVPQTEKISQEQKHEQNVK